MAYTPRDGHYLRFVRALALASGLGAAGGCTSTAPRVDAGPEASSGACVCCTTGDWSGNCVMNPMLADASHAPTPPPAGRRWCVGDENRTMGCPIAGPLAPPELPA